MLKAWQFDCEGLIDGTDYRVTIEPKMSYGEHNDCVYRNAVFVKKTKVMLPALKNIVDHRLLRHIKNLTNIQEAITILDGLCVLEGSTHIDDHFDSLGQMNFDESYSTFQEFLTAFDDAIEYGNLLRYKIQHPLLTDDDKQELFMRTIKDRFGPWLAQMEEAYSVGGRGRGRLRLITFREISTKAEEWWESQHDSTVRGAGSGRKKRQAEENSSQTFKYRRRNDGSTSNGRRSDAFVKHEQTSISDSAMLEPERSTPPPKAELDEVPPRESSTMTELRRNVAAGEVDQRAMTTGIGLFELPPELRQYCSSGEDVHQDSLAAEHKYASD